MTKHRPYQTQHGFRFSGSQISEIIQRIDAGHDWQKIINDEIYEKVYGIEDDAWEVYNHCEAILEDSEFSNLAMNL